MKRHPNIAFFGGTVVIAIMVMAAFANVAAGGVVGIVGTACASPEEIVAAISES